MVREERSFPNMKDSRSNRRQFAKAALSSAFVPTGGFANKQPLAPLTAGAKITLQLPGDFTDDDLRFAQQIGVNYVNTGTTGGTYEVFLGIKQRVEAAGLKVSNIGNTSVHNMPEVTLNLPGRDEKIAEYKQYLRNLSRAGIYYTTYAHMGNGIWSSAQGQARGGAPARSFHAADAEGHWTTTTFHQPLSHGRKFSKEELWDNYTYFIRQVVPVAEETGVRIGIHPDDPPMATLGGVPRCIFANFAGYERALQIANSPNIGVCLCCGTWMEGGDLMGKNVFEAARAFATMGKLWKIHFRNVSSPVPDFTEAFVDDGYTDMKRLMRTLVQVDFRGVLIADHVPQMVGDRRTGWAFSIGYIRALYDMARSAP